jgi:hypothetical protein
MKSRFSAGPSVFTVSNPPCTTLANVAAKSSIPEAAGNEFTNIDDLSYMMCLPDILDRDGIHNRISDHRPYDRAQ